MRRELAVGLMLVLVVLLFPAGCASSVEQNVLEAREAEAERERRLEEQAREANERLDRHLED